MSALYDLPLLDYAARAERRGFDGDTAEPEDHPRLAKQLAVVHALMLDGQWRTLVAIASAAKCSTQSASARVRDLRKSKHGGYVIERRRIPDTAIYEYRLVPPAKEMP